MKKNDLLDLSNTNILLISDDRQDYEDLKNYQYQHIDYFSSYIVALKFFQENPDLVKQYNVIFINEKTAHPFSYSYREPALDFCRILLSPDNENPPLVLSYYKYNHDNENMHMISVRGINPKHTFMTLYGHFNTFSEIIHDYYLDSCLSEDGVVKDYTKVEIPYNLQIPKNISDIKILFLGLSCYSDYEIENIKYEVSKLGITHFDYIADNNYTLEKEAITKLGAYDIILASRLYSRQLLKLQNETTNQASYYGRHLTLLEIYETRNIQKNCNVETCYCFAGTKKDEVNLSDDIRSAESSENDELAFYKEFSVYNYGEEKNNCPLIVETAVARYIKAIQSLGYTIINDKNCKINSADDYNNFYNKQINIEKENVDIYTKLYNMCYSYNLYKQNGIITKSTPGISIEYMNPVILGNIFKEGNMKYQIILKRIEDAFENFNDFTLTTYSTSENGIASVESIKDLSLWNSDVFVGFDYKKRIYPSDEDLEILKKINETITTLLGPTLEIATTENEKSSQIIHRIKNMHKICTNYFMVRRSIPNVPQVEISQDANNFYISIYNESIELSQLTIPKIDISSIYLTSLDKNGKLGKPILLNLRWAIDAETPNKISEKDIAKLKAIETKLNTYIKPLLDEQTQRTNNSFSSRTRYPKHKRRHENQNW